MGFGRFLLVLAASVSAAAGTLPTDFVSAGVLHNPYARPQVNFWASYARLVTERRVFVHGTVDVSSATKVPFTLQVSYRAGLATPVLTGFGPFTVFLLGEIGASATSTNVGGAWSAGAVVAMGLGRGWSVMLPVRVLRSSLSEYQVSLGIGVGWGR